MSEHKSYLGDSIYAQYDGEHITLTVEHVLNEEPAHQISLNAYVLHELDNYRKSVIKIKSVAEKNPR